MIKISFKLTEDEIYRGLVAISKSRSVTKIMTALGFVLVGAMLFFIVNGLSHDGFSFSFITMFPLLMGVYLMFLSEITARIQVFNISKTKNPFTEQVSVRMDPKAIRITGESYTKDLGWDQVPEIVETPEFFLFKASDGIANIVPKRAFSTDEMLRFREMIAALSDTLLTNK